MKKILVGITGSIAAYKTPELLRGLINAGFEVKSVLTKSGESFVTAITLQALTGSSVHTLLLDYEAEAGMGHIELARWADIVLIAPASANFIANLACGLCNDLLSTLCIATSCPIIIAPAMNKHMWAHPSTQENVKKLKDRGVIFLGPNSGTQACGDVGLGRMLEPNEIIQELLVFTFNQCNQLLKDINILITAGATCEPIDPVRFITNKSSGKMGYALANMAANMGAKVTLITSPTHLPVPLNCKKIVQVNTSAEMLNVVEQEVTFNDIFISSAAVSDYKVANPSLSKIKRKSAETLTLTLVPNVDILAKVAIQHKIFTVGFAAETENLLENAKTKLINKKVNLIIANDVSNRSIGFDSEFNEVYIVSHNEDVIKLEYSTKTQIAAKILQHVYEFYSKS